MLCRSRAHACASTPPSVPTNLALQHAYLVVALVLLGANVEVGLRELGAQPLDGRGALGRGGCEALISDRLLARSADQAAAGHAHEESCYDEGAHLAWK